MMDWKILAASFAALIFVSSLFVGDFAIKDFFSTLVDKIGEWVGSSPFGGMFAAPTHPSSGTQEIELKMYSQNLVINPEYPVNISFDNNEMTGFLGTLEINYIKRNIELGEDKTNLRITIPLKDISIEGLTFKKFTINNAKIDVHTDRWDISSENGSVELYDFSGFGEINNEMIVFKGNVTKIQRF